MTQLKKFETRSCLDLRLAGKIGGHKGSFNINYDNGLIIKAEFNRIDDLAKVLLTADKDL